MSVAWAPTLVQVAVYVPWLTVSTTVPGSQSYLMTFTTATSPNDTVAQTHIDDATTIITATVTGMPTTVYSLAAVVAAKYAAATLARAYARTDEDRQRADALWDAAKLALEGLATVIDNAGASALSPVPLVSAPDPVPWGDSLLIDGCMPDYRTYWTN